jgi:putative oxidoreductase
MSMFDDSPWRGRMLSVLRIAAGIMFVLAGTTKLFGFPSAIPHPLPTLVLAAGIMEAFGGGLIVLGFLTRPVAFLLSGEMAVAYFKFHHVKSIYPTINEGVPAALYCFIWLYLVFAGAGPWSIDALIGRGRRS